MSEKVEGIIFVEVWSYYSSWLFWKTKK